MSETEAPNATAEPNAGHTDDGNLSFSEVVNARLAQKEPEEEAPEESPEEVVDESEVVDDEPEDEAEGSNLTELDSLDDEQIAELAKRSEKGLLKRLGKLVAEKKAAQEESHRLRSQMEQKAPFEEPALESNPYADVESAEDLAVKYRETASFIEFAEGLLDDNEDSLSDEVIHKEGDQEWTKKKVRAALKNAQKAQSKFIPARLNEIKRIEGLDQQAVALATQAETEVEWMSEPESPLRKEYDSYMASPVVQKAIKAVPELKPLMPYMLAHAINSYKGGTRKTLKPPVLPKPGPPSNPRSSAAPSTGSSGSRNKQIMELEKRFEDSGSAGDAAKLRAARMR